MNSINIQGNILNYDTLERIAQDEEAKQAPKDYGFSTKSEVLSELEKSWGIIKRQYETFHLKLNSLKEGENGVSETRKYWMDPLLSELGYEIRYNDSTQVIDERKYRVSHRAENRGDFPIHIIGANQSLDKKYTNMRMSSHALIQEYLNHHENLYALVTNGRQLRLLRDSQLLTKISYLEFDLEKMIEEDQFSDYVLLWKLLHVTRMPEHSEKGPDSIIEQYHLNSLEAGSRIREKLSLAVKEGILKLANGLIQEPQNEALREWLSENGRQDEYYGELLRLIYRLLFIMVIEERDLIYPEELDEKTRQKKWHYYDYYSLKRLRLLSQSHYYGNEQHFDLWTYLLNVFSLYETPIGKKLGIQPLAGDLFSTHAMPHLYQCQLNNQVLLEVFRGLCFFENEQGQYLPVNYKSLDVEEFGSVYEGLLELDPAIDVTARRFSFVQGDERSISGSHYTPDELVQPLIKHSLEHLIQDILKEKISEEEKVQKLLQLTVCDVACGSGHILLAAARRIGLAVARLRSGEEQPNPTDTRKGIRDAIKHCIYGVDKNPLAVELCKVAMWLEAHVPGEPLNFLDHKIKNGDAIVGLAHLDELYNGIATEAFKAYRDEEKENCRLLKKSNREQRKAREAGQLRTHNVKEIVENKLAKFKAKFEVFQTLPENTVEEIETKKKAYKKLNAGSNWWAVKTLADLQVAQFFVDKSDIANVVTDNNYCDIMAGRKAQTKAEVMAIAKAEKEKFFHWFLEFPEVFAQGGFDCILGNPPYLGGLKISTGYGKKYLNFLKSNYPPNGTTSDLVSYFFKRIFVSLKESGFLSLITTDTISQGDTRDASLTFILKSGGVINFAIESMPWPGLAKTQIAILTISKKEKGLSKYIDGKKVDYISEFLKDYKEIGEPKALNQNINQVFNGTYYLGDGFVLSKRIAESFINSDTRNKEVIEDLIIGNEVNERFDFSNDSKIINFKDLDIEIASTYQLPFQRIKDLVLPFRLKNNRKVYREKWWIYGERRVGLYKNLSKLQYCFVTSAATKYLNFVRFPTGRQFAKSTYVFCNEDFFKYAIVQSTIHYTWARKYSSSLGKTLSYTPSRCFDSFPFPQNIELGKLNQLRNIGENYHGFRKTFLGAIQLGLTKTYNQFHNKDLVSDKEKDITELKDSAIKKAFSKESWNLYNHLQKTEGTVSFAKAVENIQELRRLHVEMDSAVLEAYGWHQSSKRWGPAIELRHNFYEVDYLPENDRVRFTIHPDARKEVLKRLLLLNHEIHESEEREIPYEELDREKIIELYREEIGSWLKRPEVPHAKTIKYLAYGEDLLPDLERKDIKEYSPYVAEICKAIENEILQKLFIPFNAQFQEEWQDREAERDTFIKEQIQQAPKLGLLLKNLKKNNTKYTLGNMHFFLNIIWNEKSSTLKSSELLQSFKDFAFEVYNATFLNKSTMADLNQLTLVYRNASAHADETYEEELNDIDKATALECRDAVRKMMNSMVESEKKYNTNRRK